MKDKDILKTVVGLNAAADLNAIRAHLAKQEAAASAAGIAAAHKDCISILSRHYEFVVRHFHKIFLKQKRSGHFWFKINYGVHFIIGVGILAFMTSKGAFKPGDDFIGTTLPLWIVGLSVVGYLVWAYSSVRQKRLGVLLMFEKLWNGDSKHDLENGEVCETAIKILDLQARNSAAFAFALHNIAQKIRSTWRPRH